MRNPIEYLLSDQNGKERKTEDGERWQEFARSKDSVYYVSSLGRFKRIQSFSVSPIPNKLRRGYESVRWMEDGKNKSKYAHRIVAEAFIPNPNDKPEVNHKDGNKHNNSVANLEWATSRENNEHARKTGLWTPLKKNEGRIKFTDEQVARVVKLVKEKGWTYRKAGATEGMKHSTVAHIMTGRRRGVKGIPKYEENTDKEGHTKK